MKIILAIAACAALAACAHGPTVAQSLEIADTAALDAYNVVAVAVSSYAVVNPSACPSGWNAAGATNPCFKRLEAAWTLTKQANALYLAGSSATAQITAIKALDPATTPITP
jgi:hypothetical protein